jgi:hypothetical protein
MDVLISLPAGVIHNYFDKRNIGSESGKSDKVVACHYDCI